MAKLHFEECVVVALEDRNCRTNPLPHSLKNLVKGMVFAVFLLKKNA